MRSIRNGVWLFGEGLRGWGEVQTPAMKATTAAPEAMLRGRYRSRIRSQAAVGL